MVLVVIFVSLREKHATAISAMSTRELRSFKIQSLGTSHRGIKTLRLRNTAVTEMITIPKA
eukprot:1623228-Amphidinium_carterae.1